MTRPRRPRGRKEQRSSAQRRDVEAWEAARILDRHMKKGKSWKTRLALARVTARLRGKTPQSIYRKTVAPRVLNEKHEVH